MGVILDRLGRGRKNVPGHRRVRKSFLSTEEKAKSSCTKMNEEEWLEVTESVKRNRDQIMLGLTE